MKKRVIAAAIGLLISFAALPGMGPAAKAAGAGGPVEIWDRAALQAMANDPAGSYVLMADIDMGDAPWTPMPFNGSFDGGGHTLYNLLVEEVDPVPADSVDGNHKSYETVYAAFFSRTQNAVIKDVTLLGVQVNIDSGQNCFAAGLVGRAENTAISGCHVSGRISLAVRGKMCGVAGMVGFGFGTLANSSADVTLTLVDGNREEKCEQFLGGMLATGYVDMDNCRVDLNAYASVYGYVHNGGVIGMYYVHTSNTGHAGYVNNCTVNAAIHFFEANNDRRAYCSPVIGEQLHWTLQLDGNTTERFENDERRDYEHILYPEECAAPVYAETVTAPGCTHFGHTTSTCQTCGYCYNDRYVAPQHQPGGWEVTLAPTAAETGLRRRFCTLCGEVAAQEVLVGVAACTLTPETLELDVGKSAQLAAAIQPADATDTAVTFLSSNEGVATVDAEGQVTAVGAGNALITCTAGDGSATAQCTITVRSPFPALLVAALGAGAGVALLAILLIVTARRRKQRAKRHANRNTYRRR